MPDIPAPKNGGRRRRTNNGDDTFVKGIHDLISEVVGDILRIRMSSLFAETAVTERAPPEHVRPTQERASIRMDVLRKCGQVRLLLPCRPKDFGQVNPALVRSR